MHTAPTRVLYSVRRFASMRRFWSSSPASAAQKDSPDEIVTVEEADRLVINSIKSFGYNSQDAAVMRDCMMWAQLRNNNQGIIKITSGGVAPGANATRPVVENNSPSGARVNGNQTMSMVVLDRAVKLAIEKAKTTNVGIVGTYNTAQSCGALGFYTEMIAKEGMIGVVMASSPEFVAPFGAKQPIFGTNPIACGVPTSQGLMLMDQATAAFPWFGLLEAKTAGRKIPNDVAYDANGQPTDDPSMALKGALRTFDRGYKSSNLALMVEMLAGPLVGAAHMNKLTAKNWGNLVLAIHPSLLGDADQFYKAAGEVLGRVRSAERLPGISEMIIPGEREAKMASERLKAGRLPLEKNMLAEMRVLAAKYEATAGAVESESAMSGDTVEILRKLLQKMDSLEAKVEHTIEEQQAMQKQQKRLETFTLASLSSINGEASKL